MRLKEGTSLQGGRYRIERMLGQGGFGITYLGIQTGLNRKVAIKEFFIKEYCNREKETSHVSVPSMGSKDLVGRLRQKFVKEAQTIAELEHSHIIHIHDVFEENSTAYYVMEYLSGGDLRARIPKRGMTESEALGYIWEIGDALTYIHERNILHLDIKPGNILFRSNGEAVLVDFGLSKHYDEVSGDQTSSTPLGISEGYAPTEQYECGGVSSFSPATDIYSLGATFYCLLQGNRPPKASIVLNDGLPVFPSHVSLFIRKAIETAMHPKRNDRPQSVAAFLSLLDASVENVDEGTVIDVVSSEASITKPSFLRNKWFIPLVFCLLTALCVFGFRECRDPVVSGEDTDTLFVDTLVQADSLPVVSLVVEEPIEPKEEAVPSTCPLYVTTSPVGAMVYVDGKKLGKSPIEGMDISRGKHTIKLVLDGYDTFTKKYNFGNKPLVVNETLVSKVSVVVPTLASEKEDLSKPTPVKVANTGMINGHEWVDLGLSVKWGTMNVGADSPGDYGDYFAWGEVYSKSEYIEKNCLTWKKGMDAISGNSQYDAARYRWGGSWRLPSSKELEELSDMCTWTWTSQDGHSGYKVTGPNGNSIFLPASGYRSGTSVFSVGTYGYYWSGSPYGSNTSDAYYLYFGRDGRSVYWNFRDDGQSLRPVSD